MDILKFLNRSDIVPALSGEYIEVISKYFIIIAVPVLIIAMINCFFGHKFFPLLVGFAGVLIGALLGAGSCIGFNMLTAKSMPRVTVIVIAAVFGAVILGFASYKLYKAGAFCMGFITGVILGVVIMKFIHKDEYMIAGVIGGLLMGLLAIDLYKHMVIFLTSMNGSLVSAACLAIIMKKDDPVFIIKTGAVLAVLGILVQYIILFLSDKRKDEEEEEDEDEQEERQIAKAKRKKEEKRQGKKLAKSQEHKGKREQKSVDKKKVRKDTNKKKNNYSSDFFLVEIFSNIAQSIKDFIMNRFENKNEYEGYEEDELAKDDSKDEFIDKYDNKVVENEVEDKFENDIKNRDQKTSKKTDSNSKPLFIIKENEELPEELNTVGKGLEQNLNNEITIPIFNLDEIEQKLEEELKNNINGTNDEELEDLIIKQTIKNIDDK